MMAMENDYPHGKRSLMINKSERDGPVENPGSAYLSAALAAAANAVSRDARIIPRFARNSRKAGDRYALPI
jgi:hypothetical protein